MCADSRETSEVNSTRAFTVFSSLPKELRLKVWRHATYLFPRTVEICQLRDEAQMRMAVEVVATSDDEDEDQVTSTVEELSLSDGDVLSQASESNSGSSSSDVRDQIPDVDDEEEEEEEIRIANPNPFYSAAFLPPLFYVNHEAREVALEHYPLSFPNASHPATIRYNASIDTLYFSAWCFQHDIYDFEMNVPAKVKANIKSLAIDNLVWYSNSDDGTLNEQVHLTQFPNLEEIFLVSRKNLGECGCCHEFHGPEKGAVSFIDARGIDVDVEGRKNSLTLGDGVVSKYQRKCLAGLETAFDWTQAHEKSWKRPRRVLFVTLLRDGKVM